MIELKIAIGLTNIILLIGAGYAWFQFYKVVKNQCDTCSIGLHQSPFKSKCFTGAIFFTLALLPALYACYLVNTIG